MIIDDTDVEKILKKLLQQDIKMYIKNKLYKKGKLILFKQNNYHLELTIKKDNEELKKFEIPIPFKIEEWEEDNLVYFDYRFSALAKKNSELYKMLHSLDQDGNSKFFDSILEIEIEKS